MMLLDLLDTPLKGRNSKPRSTGITMIIDKGLSLAEVRNLLELNSAFIDFIKLAFGTMLLYAPEILEAKIRLTKEYGIPLYPGGTFWELAHWQNKTAALYPRLRDLGFEWLEISDGTLAISLKERLDLIEAARKAGFKIITEVGKKDPHHQPAPDEVAQLVQTDLNSGATWVIIEARESGAGIGIYNREGQIQTNIIEFLQGVLPLHQVIWEAPLKHQQAALIALFGPNVNLGNLPPGEAMALEALRLGLRSDTWNQCIKKK
jgi:phosphosulfolactate synthase